MIASTLRGGGGTLNGGVNWVTLDKCRDNGIGSIFQVADLRINMSEIKYLEGADFVLCCVASLIDVLSFWVCI